MQASFTTVTYRSRLHLTSYPILIAIPTCTYISFYWQIWTHDNDGCMSDFLFHFFDRFGLNTMTGVCRIFYFASIFPVRGGWYEWKKTRRTGDVFKIQSNCCKTLSCLELLCSLSRQYWENQQWKKYRSITCNVYLSWNRCNSDMYNCVNYRVHNTL